MYGPSCKLHHIYLIGIPILVELFVFITVYFTKSLTDVHAAFGSEAKLECAVSNPMVECKWYKNGILLEGATTIADGCQRGLYFPSVSHDNGGEYECKYENEYSKATIEVEGRHALVFDTCK